MNLVKILSEWSVQTPDRIALIEGSGTKSRSVTYQELFSKVCQRSKYLEECGLNCGERVLLLQPIGIDLYINLLACLNTGICVVLVDPSAPNETIRRSLQTCDLAAFIGSPKAHLLRLKIPEIRKIPLHFHTSGWAPFSQKLPTSHGTLDQCTVLNELEPDTPALITFTSGSTGQPKAICRTHRFLIDQHTALADSLSHRQGEVDLITLPVFAIANLASGITSVIADTDLRFPAQANGSAILAQCEEFAIERCAASPAFFDKLYQENALPNFKKIYTGGAPVFPNQLTLWKTQRPDMDIVTVFGSSEAEPIAHINWEEVSSKDRKAMAAGKGLLVGSPVDQCEVKIIGNNEIIVTGDHVLKSYLNGFGDEETKLKIEDKIWHRTGDAGYFDEEGRLWLQGRVQSIIQLENGESLYPFEIECAALQVPGMIRSALKEINGQPTLLVESENFGNCLPALTRLTKNRIKIQPIDKIPMDLRHNAKVNYAELARLLEG